MGVVAFTGRLLLASLFLLSGAMKLVHHEEGPASPMVAFAAPKLDHALGRVTDLTGLQVPVERESYATLVFVAGCMELLGGILFTLNVALGAQLLMAFLVPTTIIMHNWWDLPQGSPAHQIEFVNFTKNVCLLGAFLVYTSAPKPAAALQAKLKSS